MAVKGVFKKYPTITRSLLQLWEVTKSMNGYPKMIVNEVFTLLLISEIHPNKKISPPKVVTLLCKVPIYDAEIFQYIVSRLD